MTTRRTFAPLAASLGVVFAIVIGGCPKPPPKPTAPISDVAGSSSASGSNATSSADLGPLVRLGFAGDRASPIDGPIHPDGIHDFVFRVRVSGDVVGFALIGSDVHGLPLGALQWDTYVGATKIPDSFHVAFKIGGDTAQLAVVDA